MSIFIYNKYSDILYKYFYLVPQFLVASLSFYPLSSFKLPSTYGSSTQFEEPQAGVQISTHSCPQREMNDLPQ